ncbi:double-strand break repair protein AddB [Aestuariicoccus sp. MJ-SS9]|uniref:double-strand break repair protein AddB n=1 Tax=Aestuariicoccus sp. MJ-SS9 TaxID=3079855 RepID=UPI0029099895|nr:double-strand break repair protein AddB [Aestuariicoccus sp. MJ-SS9]MDU8910857.1 double-strand break repair protein AddB [Aestuariicoccus sp. MJ-SS9]
MFEPSDKARVFALPPGVDFPQALVDGLRARLAGAPHEAMARVELIVNTRRMARRIEDIFHAGPPTLLPRIRLVTDLADPADPETPPPPVSDLRRRLELTDLVAKLIEAQPDLAPSAALFDLSDSLATLMDEMQIEGVLPEAIRTLDVSDESGHWLRALEFVKIAQSYFDGSTTHPDSATVQRLATERRLALWAKAPPAHPVILAGSTGSRGTTLALMQAAARLPQGALVLPGFDFDMPARIWTSLTEALTGEDHPQFRFARLMRDLSLDPGDIGRWSGAEAPSPARNRLLSLALRPAPVTHQWLDEGPGLGPLSAGTETVSLIEAPSPRDEALAIALRLRQAAEDGQRAALITPDRMLTRQVSAALDRWNILPDDSAGIPAQLTPPGRFLRHVAALFGQELTAEALLTLLKHPLTHRGADRGQHLLNTRDLELHIRRKAWPYPKPDAIADWATARDQAAWGQWIADSFCQPPVTGKRPLADWVAQHIARAEGIVAGSGSADASELWAENAGREVQKIVTELTQEAGFGTDLDARDYDALFAAILSRGEVRNPDTPHPDILIWGTLEARVMGADLLILGGLNEGSWPEAPAADPWLNRRMRDQAGLLLPERRIGLSAHDFQQAASAPEVWLTRAVKSDDAETVPSRWLNRLMNLMRGLPDQGGAEALEAMRARGDLWLRLAQELERPEPALAATRPSPAPPAEARPRRMSVTEVKRLVRDPFAIYAKHVLRLRPLDPLQRPPDALLRGILVHRILDSFVRETVSDPAQLRPDALLTEARNVLGDPDTVPFPTIRHLWLARLARAAEWFVDTERTRQALATPAHFETSGKAVLPASGFTLTGTADRIDIDDRGGAYVYDYKTGPAPSEAQQRNFDKQLLLEAAMIEQGAFENLRPSHVERAVFVSVGASRAEVAAPLDESPPQQTWQEFEALVTAYLDPDQGFTARRAMFKDEDVSDYDHLARFGEWDGADKARKVRLK